MHNLILDNALYTIHKMQGIFTCEQHVAILSTVVVNSFIKLFAICQKPILNHCLTRVCYNEIPPILITVLQAVLLFHRHSHFAIQSGGSMLSPFAVHATLDY